MNTGYKWRISQLTGRPGPAAHRPRPELTHDPPSPAPALEERACCCLAKPVAVAVMPVLGADDRPVDLHLCAHHYRLSRTALRKSDAVVYDGSGRRVTGADPHDLVRTAR